MNKDQNALRNTLGVLGILLPVLALFFNFVFGSKYNPPGVLTSISATHYSSGYLLFEGLVFSTGLFLLCYRGYDIKDRIVSKLAGSGAISLTLFPCALDGAETRNFLMLSQNVTNIIHLASAGLFFGSLVFLIGWQFTKTSEGNVVSPKSRKWRRNILYRVCAVVMVLGLVVGFGGKALFGWLYSVYSGSGLRFGLSARRGLRRARLYRYCATFSHGVLGEPVLPYRCTSDSIVSAVLSSGLSP